MDNDTSQSNNDKQPLPIAGGETPEKGQGAGGAGRQSQQAASHQTHGQDSNAPSHGIGQQGARAPTQLREPNTILVGKKSVMAYVLAVASQFNNGSPFVKLKARGKIISRAVDVAEIVRHRFISTAHAKEIRIGTEDLQSEDGTMSKVSSIEITLVK